ncbi:MAG: DUF3881 family protein [Lachnospiraceae bacterium]|nr:DUF3881 family protein [Lachnospiraceae bacterium]
MSHRFMRSIGFSEEKTTKEIKKILKLVLMSPTEKQYVTLPDDSIAVEYRKEFSDSFGIAVCGEFSDEAEFDYEFYYPYLKGQYVSTTTDIELERLSEKESYEGVFDDTRVGISIIFRLSNRLDYLKLLMRDDVHAVRKPITLSGLAEEGTILLPIKKDKRQMIQNKKETIERNKLIADARAGDEEAIETLTMKDIDIYSTISKKIMSEDVLTLVDTYVMPFGLECDRYSVMGEILDINEKKNDLSGETVLIMTLNCNDLVFDICVNKKDLTGEPMIGRRFKGNIWLTGKIDF